MSHHIGRDPVPPRLLEMFPSWKQSPEQRKTIGKGKWPLSQHILPRPIVFSDAAYPMMFFGLRPELQENTLSLSLVWWHQSTLNTLLCGITPPLPSIETLKGQALFFHRLKFSDPTTLPNFTRCCLKTGWAAVQLVSLQGNVLRGCQSVQPLRKQNCQDKTKAQILVFGLPSPVLGIDLED